MRARSHRALSSRPRSHENALFRLMRAVEVLFCSGGCGHREAPLLACGCTCLRGSASRSVCRLIHMLLGCIRFGGIFFIIFHGTSFCASQGTVKNVIIRHKESVGENSKVLPVS